VNESRCPGSLARLLETLSVVQRLFIEWDILRPSYVKNTSREACDFDDYYTDHKRNKRQAKKHESIIVCDTF